MRRERRYNIPGIGNNHIRPPYRLPRVLTPPYPTPPVNLFVTPQFNHPIPHLLRRAIFVLWGRRHPQCMSQARVCDEHIMQHIRRVANVGYCQRRQNWKNSGAFRGTQSEGRGWRCKGCKGGSGGRGFRSERLEEVGILV